MRVWEKLTFSVQNDGREDEREGPHGGVRVGREEEDARGRDSRVSGVARLALFSANIDVREIFFEYLVFDSEEDA